MGTTEWTVVIAVVGGRLILPLFIPYFPVPALLACLILDSADQGIFQQFPKIPLDGYQRWTSTTSPSPTSPRCATGPTRARSA